MKVKYGLYQYPVVVRSVAGWEESSCHGSVFGAKMSVGEHNHDNEMRSEERESEWEERRRRVREREREREQHEFEKIWKSGKREG